MDYTMIEQVDIAELMGKKSKGDFAVTKVSVKHEMPEMEAMPMMAEVMPSIQAHPGSQIKHVKE